MVRGIEKFVDFFKECENEYVLIGGVACSIILNEYDLVFRHTQDFDIVLIVELISDKFGRIVWDFISNGKYKIIEKSNGKPVFYRFKNPENNEYPKEIELFSRDKRIDLSKYETFMPIHISDEISSLSAILLDEAYYDFLKNGIVKINKINVLNFTHIIPFKAKAWLDMENNKKIGKHIDSHKINKHKNDIFRLSQLLNEEMIININETVRNDMYTFINLMKNEIIDLKNIGVKGSQQEYLKLLENVYINNSVIK